MSNHRNEAILDNLLARACDMTTTELANDLDLPIDALGLKPFADTPIPPCVGNEILFTDMDILTHDELVDKHVQHMWEQHSEA